MSALEPEFRHGSIHLPCLELWLDAHQARKGADVVFVSHAHSDHIAAHREVILSEATSRLMRVRLGGKRTEHILGWHEEHEFGQPGGRFRMSLLPAGHVLGSAMALIRAGDQRLLYTGDFKLRPGLAVEPCDPAVARGCDLLIMESTYGRAQYRFPPAAVVLGEVIRFCQDALRAGETPVLLTYALGKSQALLQGLTDADLPLAIHDHVATLARIYEQFGHRFPPYRTFSRRAPVGQVLICPPHVAGSLEVEGGGRVRRAVITGWAVDASCRFRYGADAAFPLSDHADFDELLEFVRQVSPRRVLTVHGFAADLATSLRELGFDAWALSEENQMTLPLFGGGSGAGQPTRGPPNP